MHGKMVAISADQFDGLLSNAKKVKGVVNDWDMSSKLGEHDIPIRSAAIHCTGTTPFMACDLLDEAVEWPHYYRHDLESSFTFSYRPRFTTT